MNQFYAFDSTTVSLFSQVMKGVGRNPKGDGKKKGGLKVHLLTDVHAGSAQFATISEAKMHDKKFLSKLSLDRGSMVTMDRAYNFYRQFAQWTHEGVFFVTRQKKNAKSQVIETLYECPPADKVDTKNQYANKRKTANFSCLSVSSEKITTFVT
jgi:hypothetical protein